MVTQDMALQSGTTVVSSGGRVCSLAVTSLSLASPQLQADVQLRNVII